MLVGILIAAIALTIPGVRAFAFWVIVVGGALLYVGLGN